jgi:pimeloyl-ACP methyl ester carboxylesterase
VVVAIMDVMTRDIRPELAKITSPALVIATWKGWPQWSHDVAVKSYGAQYAALRGAQIIVDDASLHFVMYDDPQFLFEHVDSFLAKR